MPHLGQGLDARNTPEYFINMAENVAFLMTNEVLTVQSLSRLSNILIYRSLADFPAPKITEDSTINYQIMWKRLYTSQCAASLLFTNLNQLLSLCYQVLLLLSTHHGL